MKRNPKKRRLVAACLALLFVAGCGGGGRAETATSSVATGAGTAPVTSASTTPVTGTGTSINTSGGGGATAPTVSSTPGAVTPFSGNPGIALWGDSMVPGVARAFSYILESPREIYDGGVGGQTSVEIAARELADTNHRDWITVFWYGHNNVTQPDRIKADIAASVAHLAPGNNRYIVLSVLNQDNLQEVKGTAAYDSIIRLNNELAATYGANYLDIRSFMVTQFDPNNFLQLAQFQADLPSSSLRFDAIHLTGFGSEVVGRRIMAFIESKGW